MSDSRERQDALEALVTSSGWLLFKEQARKEWGPEGYGRKVSQAIAEHTGTAALAQAVEVVHKAAEEINALMRWPADELKKLHPKPQHELSLSRVPR